MPTFADGKIEAYVGPPGLGAADDLEAVIVDFIAGARTKLDIAVQELDSEAIAKAILMASWRGVRVTLFLEQDYLRTSLKRDTTTHVPIPPACAEARRDARAPGLDRELNLPGGLGGQGRGRGDLHADGGEPEAQVATLRLKR